MKKLLILTLFSLVFASAHAQFSFNPKVGMNITSIATEATPAEVGSHVGFNLGADLRFRKKESWFFVQPGLHYYSMGVQPVSENATQEQIEQIPSVSSLKVPLSGGMYLTGSNGILRVRANVGITPTVLMGVEENQLGVSKSDYQAATIGLNGGIGIELLIITLDVSYEHGMSNLYRQAEGTANTFTISAGIRIP